MSGDSSIDLIKTIIVLIKTCAFLLLFLNGSYVLIGLNFLTTVFIALFLVFTNKASKIKTKEAIRLWKHNEQRQIRRIIHDLKQPVAL